MKPPKGNDCDQDSANTPTARMSLAVLERNLRLQLALQEGHSLRRLEYSVLEVVAQ